VTVSDDGIDDVAEAGSAPGDGVPARAAPEDGVPARAVPEDGVPARAAPAGVPPDDSMLDGGTPRTPRPLVERLGMAAIAVVLAAVFAVMAAAAFGGGEPFLGVMAGAGSLMTLWVGGLTLRRG
jgi:hypothetical protein